MRRYQSRIYSVAYTYLGDPDEARDLAQEIFVKVYRKLDECREPERFPAWLMQIARNASLDQIRRRQARPPARDLPAAEMTDLRDPGRNAEELWLADGRKRLVHRALRRLSDISREIILLRDMQELPLSEIAALLDVPLGTVKSRSNRARLELARAVKELGAAGEMSH